MSGRAVVVAVHTFPVKSLAAADPGQVTVTPSGVEGDRRSAVVDAASGALLGAGDEPRLRDVVAGYAPDGGLRLDVPGERPGLGGNEAAQALSRWLGRPVRLAPAGAGAVEAPVHLVSVQALDAARRGEHEAADCACSLEEPRANLVVDLGPDGPRREEAWIGGVLQVGPVRLQVQRRPGHCLGVYATVLAGGRIRVGDEVRYEVSAAAR